MRALALDISQGLTATLVESRTHHARRPGEPHVFEMAQQRMHRSGPRAGLPDNDLSASMDGGASAATQWGLFIGGIQVCHSTNCSEDSPALDLGKFNSKLAIDDASRDDRRPHAQPLVEEHEVGVASDAHMPYVVQSQDPRRGRGGHA